MALNTGDILQNRYRVGSLLNRGGMANIYRGWHLTLSIPIAIKEMMPPSNISPHKLMELREQFRQEAALLARLEHPNLVDVLDFFRQGNSLYLIMDLVQGESLTDRIEREGALPQKQVLKLAYQLLDALQYCHEQGVIHRDVKPSNIIIQPDGHPILVDFGLVKLWDPDKPDTEPGLQGIGTPEYAPPEQYGMQPGHTDPRSDIYGLGATLYHALTGQAPMTAADRTAAVSPFEPPHTLNPNVSSEVSAVIAKSLSLRIGDRFRDIVKMKAALERAAQRSGRQKKPGRAQQRPAKRVRPLDKLLVIIILGTIAFVLILLAIILSR
jgi:serine/threonine protein kinase